MGQTASVRDHLNEYGELPDWIYTLGENIQSLTDCSSAIAASRARDLSRLNGIGEAMEGITTGWNILVNSDLSTLTPNQRDTIQQVVLSILDDIHIKTQEGMK